MNVDQNLLFGVLALQTDLVDTRQFLEACVLWTTRKESLLVDLMLERGWIEQADKEHLDYFVKRKLQRLDGDGNRGLEGKCEEVKRSLADIKDTDIQWSPAGSCDTGSPPMALTADFCQLTIDRYELRRLHAQGGNGTIWLAHDRHLDRTVALKELRSERSNSPHAVARFVREAQITGQLQHPGITPIYDLGWHRAMDAPFYTMRFVEGTTLSDAVSAYHERRKCGETEATDLLDLLNAFVAVCKTIAYGHANGVLHRDVKSQNVVLGGFGEVIVLDWGLAKNLQDSEGERIDPDPFVGDAELGDGALTVQGQTLGTPVYMSPEQAAGRLDDIDHRTDVYGLGAMLYEILTGQPPFSGVDTQELLDKVLHEQPRPPRELLSDIPPPLEVACLRALAKNPADRFSSAIELAQTVERWQETQRRIAEEALKASEALYHSLVETIPMNVWRKDVDGRFTFANQGFCRASGRRLDECLGKTDFDLFPPEVAEKYRADDARVMATGETLDATEEHITADGRELYVRVIKLPIYDVGGRVVGTQGIWWDETDVKRLEKVLVETQAELVMIKQRLHGVERTIDIDQSPSM